MPEAYSDSVLNPTPVEQQPFSPQRAPAKAPAINPVQPWRTPYSPADERGEGLWGQDNWRISGARDYPSEDGSIPGLPSAREAISLIGSSGNLLSQFASPLVGGYYGRGSMLASRITPILDAISKGAFSKNYLAARLGHIREMQEEMSMQIQLGLIDHAKMLYDAGRIIELWKNGGITDPEAHDQLTEWANKHNHGYILKLLQDQGVEGVKKQLDWEDKHFQDVYAGYTASDAAAKAAKPHPYTDGSGGEGERSDSLAEHKIKPASGAGPSAATSSDAGTTTPPPATPSGGGDVDAALRKKYGINAEGVNAAHEALRGQSPEAEKGADPDDVSRRARATGDLRSQVGAAANTRPAGLNPADPNAIAARVNAIRGIDPGVATDIENLRNYDLDPRELGQKYRDELFRWASAVDPTYRPGWYDIAKKYNNPDSPTHRQIIGAQLLGKDQVSILNALLKIPENHNVPYYVFEQLMTQIYNGDPQYNELFQALNAYVTQAALLMGGGTTARVTLVENLLKHMHSDSSPRAIRAQMQVDARDVYGRVVAINRDWLSETKQDRLPPEQRRNVPGFNQDTDDLEDALQLMNPNTQVVPADSPSQLKGVGKSGKDVSSRLNDWQKRTPPTLKQAREMRATIEREKNNPDPDVQKTLQDWRRILGPGIY
jgi:hypothetical protein